MPGGAVCENVSKISSLLVENEGNANEKKNKKITRYPVAGKPLHLSPLCSLFNDSLAKSWFRLVFWYGAIQWLCMRSSVDSVPMRASLILMADRDPHSSLRCIRGARPLVAGSHWKQKKKRHASPRSTLARTMSCCDSLLLRRSFGQLLLCLFPPNPPPLPMRSDIQQNSWPLLSKNSL